MEVAVVKNGRPAAPRALQAQFWEGIRSGMGIVEAGRAAGAGREIAFRGFKKAGGVKSNGPRLGRAPSTVRREIRRNSRGRRHYRALAAQGQAQWRAARPKTAKLAGNAVL